MNYDIIIIGSGPGGYVAAIRASQLGLKTAIVEKAEFGGICLNWGCIPTKALLKSSQVYNYISHASNYGLNDIEDIDFDFKNIVSRSRNIADTMSRGVQYLLKKNNIEQIKGFGKVKPGKIVEVIDNENNIKEYQAKNIIIATGARSRELPNLKQDGKFILGYRQALTMPYLPKSMLVVGSGAIGSELAYFYHSMGCEITLVEFLPNIVPVEDEDVSKQLLRSFKKSKIKVLTNSTVESVDTSTGKCVSTVKTKKGIETFETDVVLSAIGITPNVENIGLEDVGIKTGRNRILVDNYYKTNIDGYYAIGDVIPGPALAHVASHEGIVCVEKIAGLNPKTIDYKNIPGCTYTNPEIASVGYTEKAAIEAGFDIKIGKFPFTASGKATSSGNRDGFVKLIFNKKDDLLLGAHLIGDNVTEIIAELVLAKKLNAKSKDIIDAIHPHPTMSEAVMEAAAQAENECIHL